MRWFKIIDVVLLLCFFCVAYSQKKEDLIPKDTVGIKNRRETNSFLFTPYIAPTYSPEQKLLISAGGLISFSISPGDFLLSRSSVPFSIGYSTTGASAISVLPYIYGRKDKFRISTKIYYKNMPDNYWGIGYDSGIRTSEPDESTNYHRRWISIEGKYIRRLKKNFFVGFSYDLNSTKASNLNNAMYFDENIIKYGTDVNNFGLGFATEIDKRDNAQNAYLGYYASFSFTKYNFLLGFSNQNQFSKSTFDIRKYFALGLKKTLALQYNLQWTEGDVPWSDLPQLGTPFDLRGYYWGRFRDKIGSFGIIEYRHMFHKDIVRRLDRYLNHFGFVTWGGVGTVAPEFKQINNFVYNGGVGLRIEIQPRMNVRLDYGVGIGTGSLYITFNEAF